MTEYELFAIDLAHEAARVSLPYFRGAYEETDKGGPGAFDPVTQADREAEAAYATPPPPIGILPTGNVRTLCVRTCDGGFFPI